MSPTSSNAKLGMFGRRAPPPLEPGFVFCFFILIFVFVLLFLIIIYNPWTHSVPLISTLEKKDEKKRRKKKRVLLISQTLVGPPSPSLTCAIEHAYLHIVI